MADVLFTNLWVGPFLCFALWFSDHQLTISGAKLYKAQDKVIFQGSYELNPRHQRDVDALHRFSFRVFLKLLCIAAVVAVVGMLLEPGNGRSSPYALVLGAFILVQLPVHFRHFQNLYQFRCVIPAAKGHIEYPRALRGLALQRVMFAILFLLLYLVTESFFILGGALMCLSNAAVYYRLALKHDATQLPVA